MEKDENEIKRISLGKKLLFYFIIFIFLFAVLEIGTRFYFYIHNTASTRVENYSDKYGWIVAENVDCKDHFEGYGEVHFTTTKYGFRHFGNIKTDLPKIFVIGDSQTEARKVSTGETYYDYIANNTKSEIFAFGTGV